MILERFILNKAIKLSSRPLARPLATAPDPWLARDTYPWFLPVQTRWKDNDQYLHMNNAVYHAIFDSVINIYLIRRVGLDPASTSSPRGFMVTNSCTFVAPAAYPAVYMAGLAVSRLGRSSVRYRLGLFPLASPALGLSCDPVQGHDRGHPVLDRVEARALATGDSTHVFVDPATSVSTAIPQAWREGLEGLLVEE